MFPRPPPSNRAIVIMFFNMDKFVNYFNNKKITVMGLGLLGRGVGDAEFLASAGADLIVTDLKTEQQLQESFNRLKNFSNIKFRLGEHKLEDFEGRDMVLVSAGVPSDSEYLTHASTAGARLTQSAALFAELSKIPIIGITGTRGKSTVTAMIHHVLEAVTGEKVIKGGNIRGVSNLQLLKEVKEDSLAVFELDSWQLQGFGWAGISPHVAVFTNFMDDHLNYYGSTSLTTGGSTSFDSTQDKTLTKSQAMDAYFADKANIFINQDEDGVFITTPEVLERAEEFALLRHITLGQEVILVDSSILPEDCLLAMPGEHNRLNAALAYEALKTVSLKDEEIFEGLASFGGVEGRLQLIANHNGVKIYNDNNATTPQATIAGLTAVGNLGEKNIILIAGGADKNIDVASLAYAIIKYCKNVILIPGTGTNKLAPLLHNVDVGVSVLADLSTAVNESIRLAVPGDTILFSPAFASFGMFTNEYERNDKFVRLIRQKE